MNSMRINKFTNLDYSIDEIISTKNGKQIFRKPIKIANINMDINTDNK